MPIRVLEQAREALSLCQPLAHAADQATGAGGALSQKVDVALQGLHSTANKGTDAPPENVARHEFKLLQLDEQFLYDLMRERGWEKAAIIVGSAQGEGIARRTIHGASLRSRLKEQVAVYAVSSGKKVADPNGWALIEQSH